MNSLYLILAFVAFAKAKDMYFDKLEAHNCENYDNQVLVDNFTYIGGVGITENKMFGQLIFLKDVENLDFKYKVMKCTTRLFNRCIFQAEDTQQDACKQLTKSDAMWGTFFNDIKFSCPVKAGTYPMNGARFSTAPLTKYPFLRGIWKIHIIGMIKKSPIFCLELNTVIA